MMKRISLILLSALLFSCSLNAKKPKNVKPEWLKNPKSVYPENRYLSALGEGDSRQQAENMAAANLSRIFRSDIRADETINQRYRELTTGDEFEYEDETNVNKKVNISSQQTLFNLQFGESWTDNLGRVHTIAYLDRMRTADIYEQKITKNSERIIHFLDEERTASDPIKKYAALNAASVVADINEVLIGQLNIIFPSGIDMLEMNYDQNNIRQKMKDAAQQIGFKIQISNDNENKISNLLEEMVNNLGFSIKTEAIILLEGQIEISDTDLKRDNIKFVRYDLKMNAVVNDEIIVTMNEKGREGHVSLSEARARAIRTLKKKIEKDFKTKLIDYFDQLVLK